MLVRRVAFMLAFATSATAAIAEEKSYPDGRSGEVVLPLGDPSFADEVVSFTRGDPSASDANSIPEEALGPPDYDASVDDRYLTLGCAGELVVRFTDNALGDVDGPDIFVFEIGDAVESSTIAVSKNGETWAMSARSPAPSPPSTSRARRILSTPIPS